MPGPGGEAGRIGGLVEAPGVALPTAIEEHPSPNHDARPAGAPVDLLILHYTGMASAEAACQRLTDPAAKVSAHYLIGEDGAIRRLVAEPRRAWHAGLAYWAGARDINGRSIGIELVNPGHEFGYRRFPEPQIGALVALARNILERHRIPAHRILGHSDVAPGRKQDPGELFDWRALATAGIGLWPGPGRQNDGAAELVGPGSGPETIKRLQRDLACFGYEMEATGRYDRVTRLTVTAFQRHWRPANIDGIADGETRAILGDLLDQMARSA